MHELNAGKGVYIIDLVNKIIEKELLDAGCVSLSPTSASTPLLPQNKRERDYRMGAITLRDNLTFEELFFLHLSHIKGIIP